jgi:hypothetical protein
MTKIINTPDGPRGFPDDMSMDDIAAVMKKQFPPRDQNVVDAQAQMSAMTQHPGPAIAEQTRQRDVADYAALPAWKRPVADVVDLVNTAGRSAAGLVTGAVNLGSRALAATGAGTPVVSMTPEEVMARFRSGQSSGPAFDAEVAKQKRQTEASRNRLQWAAPVAEAAPLALAPIARVAEGLPLLNTMLTGAGVGAATAAGNKEDPLLGAAGGAAGAAGGHVVGQGLGWALNKGLGAAGKVVEAISPSLAVKTGLKVPAVAPNMTGDDLKQLASAAYDEANSHGVIFNRAGLTDLKNKIISDFTKRSYDPVNEPGAAPILKRLDDYLATGNATFEGLHSLRRLASNGYRPGLKSNNALIGKAIDRIDELVNKMDPAHMAATTANPRAAAEAARYARLMYHRGSKVDTVENLIERGRLQGSTNISQNVPQRIQKQVAKIADPMGRMGRGFTAAEKEAARVAASRSGQQAFWHGLSGLMPRDKLSTSIAVAPLITGAMMGGLNPVGAGLAIAGTGAKMLVGHLAEKQSAKLAQQSVDELVRLIASGGLPKQTAQSILQRLAASKRAAVLAGLGRAGMGFGAAAANQLYRANSQNEAANP